METKAWTYVCLLLIASRTVFCELCLDTDECNKRIVTKDLCDQSSEADFINENCRKFCGLCNYSRLDGGENNQVTVAPPSQCQDTTAEVAFVLDASSSLGKENFQKVRNFTQQVTQRLKAEYQKLNVTVITFSNEAQVVLQLNETVDVNVMVAAESGITYTHGGTQTHKALQLAYTKFHHDVNSTKIAIVVTDGASFEPELTRQAAAYAKSHGVTIFVVAVGDDVNPHETKDISSDPDERYMRMLQSFNDLQSIVGVFHIRNCTAPMTSTSTSTTTTTTEAPVTERPTTVTNAPQTEPQTAPITATNVPATQRPGLQTGQTPTAFPATVQTGPSPTARPPFIQPSTTTFVIKTPGANTGQTPSAGPQYTQTGATPSMVPPVVTPGKTEKPTLQTGVTPQVLKTSEAPETTKKTTTTTAATQQPTTRPTTTTTEPTTRPATKLTTTTTAPTTRPTTKSTTTTKAPTTQTTTKSTTTTTAPTTRPTTKSTTTTTAPTTQTTTKSTTTTKAPTTTQTTTKSTTTTKAPTTQTTTKSTTTTTVPSTQTTTKSTTTTTVPTTQPTTKSTTTTAPTTRPTTRSTTTTKVPTTQTTTKSTTTTTVPTTQTTAKSTTTTAPTTAPTTRSTTTTKAPTTTQTTLTTTTTAPTTRSTTTTTAPTTSPTTKSTTTTASTTQTTTKSTTATQIITQPITHAPPKTTTTTVATPEPTKPTTTTTAPTTKTTTATSTVASTQQLVQKTTTTVVTTQPTKKPTTTTAPTTQPTSRPTTTTTQVVTTQTPKPTTTTKEPTTQTTTKMTTTTEIPVTTTTKPPTTTTASCIAKFADVVFVVDTSGSIGLANFEKVKAFIKEVIMTFDVDPRYTRVGLIEYSTYAHIEFKLNEKTNLTDLLDAVDNVTYSGGGTSTAEALQLMRIEGYERERPAAPDIAIVITDGLSKFPRLTRAQANLAKKDGITMFSIGIGNETASSELAAIASNRHYVFEVGDYETLLTLDNVVAHRACGIELPEEYHSRSTTTPSTTPTGCVDLDANCVNYPRDSCTDYEPYARKNCALKCGYCPGKPIVEAPCEDTEANCASYGTDMCFSSTQYEWVDEHCRKFCSFCGNKTEIVVTTTTTPATTAVTTAASCFDEDAKCDKYGGPGMCTQPSYEAWAKYHCKKYCNYCYTYHTVTSATVNQVRCPKWTLPDQCTLVYSVGQCCPYPKCPDGFKLTIKRHLK